MANTIFIFLLVLFSLNFFSATFAQTGLFKNISFGFTLLAILVSLPFTFVKTEGFVFPVQLICFSIAFSMVMSNITWDQSVIHALSTIPYLSWIVFFYLLHTRFSISRLEKIILFYGSLYIALYFFQFLQSGTVYFGFTEEFDTDRGVVRIMLPGAGVFFLSFFLTINRIKDRTKMRSFYIAYSVLAIVVTILQVTRQNIAFVVLLTIFQFMKDASIIKKVFAAIIAIGFLGYFFSADNPLTQGLLNAQKETASEGSNYIRILAAKYFMTDFSPHPANIIFGNGMANRDSVYGAIITNLETTSGFYLGDVGLVGMYVMFGVVSLLAYFLIFYKGLKLSVPREYMHLKYYMWFLLLTSLTSDNIFSINFVFTNTAVVYCLHVLAVNKNRKHV